MKLVIAVTFADWDEDRRRLMAWFLKALGPLPDYAALRVVKDIWNQGVWRVTRAAFQVASTTPDATHFLWLQEDMIPAPGFLPVVGWIARERPERVVSFFSMRKSLLDAQAQKLHWIKTPD